MILLRCTIDSSDTTALQSCKKSLKSLRQRLHAARDEDEWDLADTFLNQCDDPISRFLDDKHHQLRLANTGTTQDQPVNQADSTAANIDFDLYLSMFGDINYGSDFPYTIDSLGHPHETAWNMSDLPSLEPC